jgi:hypothetical protein
VPTSIFGLSSLAPVQLGLLSLLISVRPSSAQKSSLLLRSVQFSCLARSCSARFARSCSAQLALLTLAQLSSFLLGFSHSCLASASLAPAQLSSLLLALALLARSSSAQFTRSCSARSAPAQLGSFLLSLVRSCPARSCPARSCPARPSSAQFTPSARSARSCSARSAQFTSLAPAHILSFARSCSALPCSLLLGSARSCLYSSPLLGFSHSPQFGSACSYFARSYFARFCFARSCSDQFARLSSVHCCSV